MRKGKIWVCTFHFAAFNRYFRVGKVNDIYIYIYILSQRWEKIQLESNFASYVLSIFFLISVLSELLGAKIE